MPRCHGVHGARFQSSRNLGGCAHSPGGSSSSGSDAGGGSWQAGTRDPARSGAQTVCCALHDRHNERSDQLGSSCSGLHMHSHALDCSSRGHDRAASCSAASGTESSGGLDGIGSGCAPHGSQGGGNSGVARSSHSGCAGHAHSHGHARSVHTHSHSHHHCGHHHYHSHAGHDEEPALVRALESSGFLGLSERLEHSNAAMIASLCCFAASMALTYMLGVGALATAPLGVATAAVLAAKAALGVTFFLSGIPQLAETLVAVAHKQVDTHVLMSLSVVGTIFMGMPQESALLLLLFRGSHFLEHRLTARAAGSLERLFASVPDMATLVELDAASGGPRVSTAQAVRAADVAVGQHVLVRPGEQVPLDGRIVWGTSNCSLQHISGESQPVRLGPGSEVPAGSVSTDGTLVVAVTESAEDSTPARIARLTAEAQASRPQLQRWLDRVGSMWSKAVIAATLATAVLLPLLGVPFLGERGALYRAMGVLTAAAPCALALVPLAYVCSIATITLRGILVKNGAALDALHSVRSVALDKTGTITTGSLSLSEGYMVTMPPAEAGAQAAPAGVQLVQFTSKHWQQGAGGSTGSGSPSEAVQAEQHALKAAVALSRLSNHPVSRAMVEAGSEIDHDVSVDSVEQVPGAGVQGVCQINGGEPMMVRFGALDWVATFLGAQQSQHLQQHLSDQHGRQSRAVAFVSMTPLAGDADSLSSLSSSSGSEGSVSAWSVNGGGGASGSPTSSSSNVSGLASSYSGVTDPAARAGSDASSSVPDLLEAGAAERPASLAMLCFEDEVQAGVPAAVQALQSGDWRGRPLWGAAAVRDASRKQVVMLTGDNERVAHAVAAAVGIGAVRAGLRPEEKLAYVREASKAAEAAQQAAAASRSDMQQIAERMLGLQPHPAIQAVAPSTYAQLDANGSPGGQMAPQQPGGLLMAGDGINDAPALAAATVGVAIAGTPSDMVAAAADVIVLNGQGIANLPWLFHMAQRTQDIVRQNLALALFSVVVATLPTVAGLFPLWLAVTLHEGSTLLVALNSLRLLLEAPPAHAGAPGSPIAAVSAAADVMAGKVSAKEGSTADGDDACGGTLRAAGMQPADSSKSGGLRHRQPHSQASRDDEQGAQRGPGDQGAGAVGGVVFEQQQSRQ